MTQDYLRLSTVTAATFKRLSDNGQLELRPPYQRNPVWLEGQKSYLIDTILHGFPVPELYMQVVADETGSETHVVVDGQQRLTALLDFIAGEYALSGLDSSWNDSSFEDLSPEEKTSIFSYNFVVRMLPDMLDEQIRAIFQRLNRNVVALSRQELRHATYWGEFIKSMEELATEGFWRNSGVFTANEVRRMLDVEFISELAIGIMHGPQNKKISLERWYAVYETEYEERQRTESIFRSTLGEIDRLLPEISRTRWSKKSDFYTLFLYLISQADKFPLASDERDALATHLVDFATQVGVVLRLDPSQSATVIKPVLDYSRAVQRAASDLGNRRTRAQSLQEFISGERGVVDLNSEQLDDASDENQIEDTYDEE
ncbi:DUF262 domain-containing protein [Rathayibacter sp. VKM Ac-2927]|uniref:DUF262 domain-containing protein n=1 Tax=Rathayibacter sp. VKM Ac-2927 TaxID=2929478 RepID=UPI001FB2300C|nr:DUF262 domain-containing protein [Rathayibacter sp. VKM Ac-2927]MCJ1688152.1 DUF262 domain-containing protein [Rathayibacter sp. VKM Ac-2927]